MKNTSSYIIHTLLVDDHPLIRKGMCAIFKDLPFNLIVDEASNGLEAVNACANKNYQLIFLDIEMPKMNGVEAAGIIKKKYPDTKIIAITYLNKKSTFIGMLETGVDGYILKDIEIPELIKGIELVLDGSMYITPQVKQEWSDYLANNARKNSRSNTEELSEREIEILKLICLKMTSAQIAEKLFLSKATVNNHRANILKKINEDGNIGMLLYAIRNGYCNPEID